MSDKAVEMVNYDIVLKTSHPNQFHKSDQTLELDFWNLFLVVPKTLFHSLCTKSRLLKTNSFHLICIDFQPRCLILHTNVR